MGPLNNVNSTRPVTSHFSGESTTDSVFSCSIKDLEEHPTIPNKGDARLIQHPLQDPVNDAVSRLAIFAALSNMKW